MKGTTWKVILITDLYGRGYGLVVGGGMWMPVVIKLWVPSDCITYREFNW
jgi:hypothetical protein